MNKLVKYIIESRFNFNIDLLEDIDNEEEFSLSKQLYKSKSMKQEYVDNNLFVDLGLPSGTLWCKYNLGCDFAKLMFEPENTKSNDWYGKYYAWGEIKDKDEYNKETYKYVGGPHDKFTKYCTSYQYGYNGFCDNITKLLPEDDAAYLTNHDWRIPTLEQIKELIDNTIDVEYKDFYKGIDCLRGFKLISIINKKSIFIPFAGYKLDYYVEKEHYSDHNVSNCAYIQTSEITKNNTEFKYTGVFTYNNNHTDSFGNIGMFSRFSGMSIRPVINK